MSYFPLTVTGGVVRSPEIDYENALLEKGGFPAGRVVDADTLGVGPDLDDADGPIGLTGINICQLGYEPVAPEIVERIVGGNMPHGFRA
ncbi:MAG: hypothetical protein WD885_00575 [Candidatus Saccharimonadales bacterium]